MPDLSSDAFALAPDPLRLLGAVLRATGPVEFHTPPDTVDPFEEIHVEQVTTTPDLDGHYRVSIRQRETYSDRLYRLLAERWPVLEPDDDDDELDTREAVDEILRALGADPHRIAP